MPPLWKRYRERSFPWAIRLLVFLAFTLGRRVSRLLLWPISLYFLLTGPALREASRAFMSRALDRSPRWRDSFWQVYYFANCALDRVFLLTHRFSNFQIRLVDGRGAIWTSASGTGAILLTAHLGSFDVLRVLGKQRSRLEFKVVMDRAQGRMITDIMSKLNPQLADEIIDAAEGPALVLRLKEALDRGCVVGLMADRISGDDPGVAVDFLGSRVRLPTGPWKLASALGYPVVLCFGIYEGANRYTLHFEEFARAEQVPRAARAQHAQAAAQQFATRLEHYARAAPYNWFNFFDFWPDDAPRD